MKQNENIDFIETMAKELLPVLYHHFENYEEELF